MASPPILRYLTRRLLQVLPIILLILVANFFLLRLAPGDMAEVMAGEAGSATPEFMAQLRHAFGEDQPLAIQFLHYAQRILTLDLGFSFRNHMPVLDLILARLPATALLMLASLAIALVGGSALGAAAALNRGRWIDGLVSAVSNIGFATPLFWVGLMLIVLFAVKLQWLPAGGMVSLGRDLAGGAYLGDLAAHLVLPVFCLSIYYIGIYARMVRAAVLEVIDLDHVRTARARGLSPLAVFRHHILRNALLPVVTMTGVQLGALFGGSIAIETVFSWPGLGRLAFEAVFQRDLNLLLGVLVMSSFLVVLVNLAVDLLYALLDPRIEIA